MVIALTTFETLCGFRSVEELSGLLSRIGPFQQLVGDEATQGVHLAARMGNDSDQEAEIAIRNAFVALLAADSERVKACCRELVVLAQSSKERRSQNTGLESPGLAELVIRIYEEHPDDIGLFIMFFMNHVRLDPGEALFIQSGELHAYLKGGRETQSFSDFLIAH
jgi:mannose-6-phosphate isomerase